MDIQTANLLLLIGVPLLAFAGVFLFGHLGKQDAGAKVKAMPQANSGIDIDNDVVGEGSVDPGAVFKSDGIHMYD
jgi:hypothetical protein